MTRSPTSVPPPSEPTRLEYASRLAQRGVVVEVSTAAVRVSFPHRYTLGHFFGTEMLKAFAEVGVYLVLAAFILGLSMLFSELRDLAIHVVSHWEGWVFFSLMGLAIYLKVRPLWRTRANLPTIELNDVSLSFAHYVTANGDVLNLSLPRNKVYDFKFCEHSGNLVIRADGSEILECQPHGDEAVLRDVARIFRDALRLP